MRMIQRSVGIKVPFLIPIPSGNARASRRFAPKSLPLVARRQVYPSSLGLFAGESFARLASCTFLKKEIGDTRDEHSERGEPHHPKGQIGACLALHHLL